MSSQGEYASIFRLMAVVGFASVLTVGCTGEGAPQAPTPANPPASTPRPGVTRSVGSLAYGVDGDIYVADWDGSNAVRIANGGPPNDCRDIGEYWGEGPIWSPDGRYLAFRHTDCDDPQSWWDVVISDPKGNVVATFPSEGWLISWSPDSTRVATWVRWAETLAVYGLDGERQAVLTLPPGLMAPGDYDPVWSADGASLMVPHGVEIPLDGSTPRKLPWAADQDALQEAYSPDGSRVAYMIGRSFVVAKADGSNAQEVFGEFVWDATWSPAGNRIAFTSGQGSELRVLDVATGTVTLLTEKDWPKYTFSVIDFSPEGDRILFSKTEDRGTGVSSLWSVNADGSHLRRLVAGTAYGDWRSPSQTR
jgi:WD40 repeat protein